VFNYLRSSLLFDKQQALLLLLQAEKQKTMKHRSRAYGWSRNARGQMRTNLASDRHVVALLRQNIKLARRLAAGKLGPSALSGLRDLTVSFGISVALGDLLFFDGRWYVTNAGLLRLAYRTHCASIRVEQVREYCDPSVNRWVFRATVYKSPRSKGFVGYGDADPSNTSPLVRGAEMRVAETRAVNRALRKAYGIGLCSVEELGYLSSRSEPSTGSGTAQPFSNGNNSANGHPRLRDRLCLLIRQHQLDPTLVKRYAADFCGTQELREANRDLVESFITHLAEWAAKDRAGLVCKLNSYAQPQEVRP
jgi:hypothetical protein